MRNVNRAPRAARFLVQGSLANDDVTFLITTRARSSLSFIFCLCMKTIGAKKAKVHFAYFVQRDQHGITVKH